MTEEILPDHTRLSASGAERWMECPASLQIAETLGLEDEESSFAAEGTAAHELASTCLEDGTDAWEHFGETFYEHEVNMDMALAVQIYLDRCRDLMAQYPDAEVLIEKRVDNKDLHPDFGGTSDFTLIAPKVIFTKDYKHGKGIAKEAVGNPQMRYYGLGNFYKLSVKLGAKIERVENEIVQPRAYHHLGPIRHEEMTRGELIQWGNEKLFPAMEAVDDIGPALKSGTHCQFCPAKTGCPLMAAMFDAAAKADLADAKKLTDEELGQEFERVDAVAKYIKGIKDEAYSRAMKGKSVPGGKLVEGRVDRIWNEAGSKKIITDYGDDAYQDKKLKSPAMVEKTCVGGNKFASEYGYKPKKGKLTFVPESATGKPVTVEPAAKKFEGIKSAAE